MVVNRDHVASWAANSAVFVGALVALGPVLLVASFAIPTDGLRGAVYDAAFSIFPQVCPQSTPLSECSRANGLPVLWSWLLWVPSAVCYGFLMREAPMSRRVLVGVAFVIVVLGLLQGIVHGAGLQQYIDAV